MISPTGLGIQIHKILLPERDKDIHNLSVALSPYSVFQTNNGVTLKLSCVYEIITFYYWKRYRRVCYEFVISYLPARYLGVFS